MRKHHRERGQEEPRQQVGATVDPHIGLDRDRMQQEEGGQHPIDGTRGRPLFRGLLAKKRHIEQGASRQVQQPAHQVMQPRLGNHRVRCQERQHGDRSIRPRGALSIGLAQVVSRVTCEHAPDPGPVPVVAARHHVKVVADPAPEQARKGSDDRYESDCRKEEPPKAR
jgi:hypothetical protein